MPSTRSAFVIISVVIFLVVRFFDMRDFEISSRIGFEKAVFSDFFEVNVKSSFGQSLDVIEDDAVVKIFPVPGRMKTSHQLTYENDGRFLLLVILYFDCFFD